MCLGIPAQLVEVIEPGLAKAEVSGVRREVSTALLPEAEVGDWVLVHVGFALHTIDEEEAAKTLELLDQIEWSDVGEPMVPPRSPSFATRDEARVRSGESAVSPPRAERPRTNNGVQEESP